MAFTVVYDACVLYPAPLRDFLLRLAQTGAFRARCTQVILDEVFRNIQLNRPDLSADRLARTRSLMVAAVPDFITEGWEGLVTGLSLPDVDDRHVLAAAIRAGAQAIVTFNLRDFPSSSLGIYGVEAVHPDEFVYDVLDIAPAAVLKTLDAQSAGLRNPPASVMDVLAALQNNGLHRSVAKVRDGIGLPQRSEPE
jgi:hypothetical protein